MFDFFFSFWLFPLNLYILSPHFALCFLQLLIFHFLFLKSVPHLEQISHWLRLPFSSCFADLVYSQLPWLHPPGPHSDLGCSSFSLWAPGHLKWRSPFSQFLKLLNSILYCLLFHCSLIVHMGYCHLLGIVLCLKEVGQCSWKNTGSVVTYMWFHYLQLLASYVRL